jgi:flagellar basal-body rod protein FlgG
MNDALYIAATGMNAQQTSVDTIANNLANANTPGFKRSAVSFQDLMRHESTDAAAGLSAAASLSTPGRAQGVGIVSTLKYFGAGELRVTDSPMDLAVRGEGFIEVQMPDGTPAFTRGGALVVNKDGLLATAEGQVLKPAIHVGRDIKNLKIAADGTISATDANFTNRTVELGRLELVSFANPSGLESLGGKVYRATEASGDALTLKAGEAGVGAFAQGFVESSNVKLVDEMVSLMVAQRAYEMNVKVIQAADDMLGMSNNLRR